MRVPVVGLIAFIVAACGVSPPKTINDDYALIVPEEDRNNLLDDLFNCDECVNGQLRRVQELGNTAVPILADALSGGVPDKTAEFEARCERINNRLADRDLQLGDSCTQYGVRFQNNLERRYRARAVEGLLAIRTRQACDDLRAALGENMCVNISPFPPHDIKIRSGRSLQRMGVSSPVEP